MKLILIEGQTNVECPSENHVPTVTGFIPLATNLLVIKSIAEIWSASNAWRRPSVYAKTAVDARDLEKSVRRMFS